MESRPKITDLFRSANASGLTNSKHKRLFQSLQWRQAFEHSPIYEYTLETGTVLQVQQIPNGELKGLGTGTFVWPAAHILAKYFEKRFGPDGLRGKTLCDIGSGTGLTGFVAAALGGTVTLTDQACVLPLLSENVCSVVDSGLGVHAEQLVMKEYHWGEKSPLAETPFDFLIVSDCVLPKLYPIDILVEVSLTTHALQSILVLMITYCCRRWSLCWAKIPWRSSLTSTARSLNSTQDKSSKDFATTKGWRCAWCR